MGEPTSSLRFVCWHTGPRGRQYGIPAVLQQAGMLERFYTDFCIGAATGRLLGGVWPRSVRPPMIQNLLSRTLPADLPRSRVRTLPLSVLAVHWRKGAGAADLNARLRDLVRGDGLRGANAVYSIFNRDLELLQEAKSLGFKVVHDHVLTPDVGLILREERSLFPGIERQESEEAVWAGIERDRAQWALAELVLAPAEYSREAIERLGGDKDRIGLVPYGISEDWLDAAPQPRRGRVLFVGSVGLRKGTHYLAEATRLLQTRGVDCEVVVVGRYDPDAIRRPEFQGPIYTGPIARSQVREQFLRADIFVHPSLAEGCATAALEALACGLPVVATPNAGTLVRDGVEGFIVPIREPGLLADRIEALVTDPALRERMSAAARRRAQDATWRAYRERLMLAFSKLARES